MTNLPDAIRQDHSSVSAERAKAEQRSEIARQIADYLSRGGQIEQVPTGVGEYQTLTITERERRKRERLRGRVLDAQSSADS